MCYFNYLYIIILDYARLKIINSKYYESMRLDNSKKISHNYIFSYTLAAL